MGTKHRQATARPKDSWENALPAFVEASVDAFLLFDQNLNLVAANPAAEKLFRLPKKGGATYVGMNAGQVLPNAKTDGAYDKYSSVLSTGEPFAAEGVVQTRRGQRIHLDIRAFKAGTGLGVTASDISEHKRAEEVVQVSESLYRTIFDNAPVSLGISDPEGNVLAANRSMLETTGYTLDELRSTNLAGTYVDPGGRDRLLEALHKAGKVRDWEVSLRRKDGTAYVALLSILEMELLGEKFFLTTERDVSERKRMEEALKESEENFRALAENSLDCISVFSGEGGHVYANKRVPETTGYSIGELLEKTFRDLVHPDDLKKAEQNYARRLRGEPVPGRYEIAMVTKDGRRILLDLAATRTIWHGKPAVMGVYRDITDRKQAENALREASEKYRGLAELLPQVVFEVDTSGKFTFANQRGFQLSGYAQDDVERGLSVLDVLVPEDRDRARENIRRVLKGEKTSGNEYTMLRKDRSTFPAVIYSSPIIRDGKAVGLRGIGVDVTDQKKAEQALKGSEERFRALIENASDVIIVIGQDGTIKYESPAVERMLGYKPEEVTGLDSLTFIHPDDLPKVTEQFSQVLQQPGVVVRTEVGVRHKNGSWRVAEAVGRNLLHDPAVQGIIINYRDITERKLAEAKLAESEQRFRAIAEAIPIPVSISRRRDGVIVYANRHLGSTLGVPSAEMLGRKTADLYHDAADREAMLDRVARGRHVRDVELQGRRPDGAPLWVVASFEPLEFEGEEALMFAAYDITERKEMEDRLKGLYEGERRLREQLEVEMNRRVEFTRALAHELKTPLTSVLASSELLASELKEEPLLGLARNISRGAMNLNSTIDELLDLARGEVGMLQLKLESVDLSQPLRQMAESMAPLASKRSQSLVVEVPSPLPTVQADIARLQQVVVNLLSNAVKFSPVRGTITLRAKVKDSSIIVEVQDTGRGISKEEQKHLFEPYHRLQRDGKGPSGLGLGLSLSKTLIELHGGEIWAKSRAGRGATFGFSLPLEEAGRLESAVESVQKLWKVLIVEDDQGIVDSVSLLLQMRWPEAQLVSTGLGEEGIELVESEAPDIVIVDLGLPDISGFEVLRQVRLFSSVPVVILTVKTEEADMVKGLEWGADDYIIKPFRQSEFLARLKVQLRKQTPPDQEMPVICGSLRLDPSTFQLTHGGREISLTIIEGNIIQCLMQNAGHVVTHTRLAEAVWGEDYPGALDSLRVYIRYLRQKLERDPSNPKLILTKPGVGYSLVKPV